MGKEQRGHPSIRNPAAGGIPRSLSETAGAPPLAGGLLRGLRRCVLPHKSTAASTDGNRPSDENSRRQQALRPLSPFPACPCVQDQTEDPQARREPGGHVPVETLVPRALQRHLHHRYPSPSPLLAATGPNRPPGACAPSPDLGGSMTTQQGSGCPPALGVLEPCAVSLLASCGAQTLFICCHAHHFVRANFFGGK